ncbi:MAG TPA: SDR family oxidoreductase [Bacteroidales bacterium]|jgi:NAD(P)-dependent dehydrogenase (short-subunit alcohol dehydrogenase family)|nr:SDR family NAD(P)-dependent oxidoreductase [Bacteroidales bacterium]OQB61776.1 MAG: 3-oxoacyl-(acyl-carrier-protein) reductase FabG [Bacteroidetes bacterium ADurb.Bin145]NMD03104.1 SDR family oxidoreductase [Bacteroidales bacterium]HOU01827.1 SDR family oxidoreductase [Bacteroidales bacterium]HQG62559.1 SDR family oxidoreductase [Bacteroidales bacterium]
MGKVILITGVSSGFGRETALMLSDAGHKVYGTVRKLPASLGSVELLQMDLTDHASIKKAVESIIRKEGRIDVLINNAGMHSGGPAETTPPENIRLQIETNLIGTIELTRETIPWMRKQGGGRIINFSSIGGLMGLPFQAYYSAAKFALEGFSEALRMEIRQFGIEVVLINPGDFHTKNSENRRKFLAPCGPEDPYNKQFDVSLRIIENDETKGWAPQRLARKLIRIVECKNPRHRYIIASPEQKLAVLLKYILPGKLFRKILESHYGIK